MSYPTGQFSLSFEQNEYCAAEEVDTLGGSSVAAPGQKVNTGSDSEETRQIDGTTLAILWSLLGVFMVGCLVFIGIYLYKWKHSKVEQVHVNLNSKELDLEEDPTTVKGTFETLDVNQVPIVAAGDATPREEVAV